MSSERRRPAPKTERQYRLSTVPRQGFGGSGPRSAWAAISEGKSPALIRDRDRLYRWLLAASDLASACLALAVMLVAFDGSRPRVTMVLALPIVVLANKLLGLYDRDELLLRKTTLDEVPSIFHVATLYALICWLFEDLLVVGGVGRGQVLVLWLLLFVATVTARALARRAGRFLAANERVVVLGDERSADRLRDKLRHSAVKAEIVATLPLESGGHWSTLETPSAVSLKALITEHDVHRVVVAASDATAVDDQLDIMRMVKALGVRVSILPRIFEVIGSSVIFDDLDGMTLLGVRRFGLTRSSQIVKRGMDVVAATFGGVLLLPFAALIAAAVKLTSPGPVFFRQPRVGRDGRVFHMLKFRTMVVSADERKAELQSLNETDGLFKMRDDPRITLVGRILRKASFDELPQLWNVVHGEMSLVGPRPLVLEEDLRVEGWQRRRLHLTPGMTGPWQILTASRVPLDEMVLIDYLYVANWSLWNDVKILLRTIPHVVGNKGL